MLPLVMRTEEGRGVGQRRLPKERLQPAKGRRIVESTGTCKEDSMLLLVMRCVGTVLSSSAHPLIAAPEAFPGPANNIAAGAGAMVNRAPKGPGQGAVHHMPGSRADLDPQLRCDWFLECAIQSLLSCTCPAC